MLRSPLRVCLLALRVGERRCGEKEGNEKDKRGVQINGGDTVPMTAGERRGISGDEGVSSRGERSS